MSDNNTLLATGRRKRATARVRIVPGSGKLVVNGRPFDEYFTTEQVFKAATAPLAMVEMLDRFDVIASASGGGMAGQAGAVSLGLARALQKSDAELRSPLKKAGLMRRDPREKERKKTGQPGARKRFQFSKR